MLANTKVCSATLPDTTMVKADEIAKQLVTSIAHVAFKSCEHCATVFHSIRTATEVLNAQTPLLSVLSELNQRLDEEARYAA